MGALRTEATHSHPKCLHHACHLTLVAHAVVRGGAHVLCLGKAIHLCTQYCPRPLKTPSTRAPRFPTMNAAATHADTVSTAGAFSGATAAVDATKDVLVVEADTHEDDDRVFVISLSGRLQDNDDVQELCVALDELLLEHEALMQDVPGGGGATAPAATASNTQLDLRVDITALNAVRSGALLGLVQPLLKRRAALKVALHRVIVITGDNEHYSSVLRSVLSMLPGKTLPVYTCTELGEEQGMALVSGEEGGE